MLHAANSCGRISADPGSRSGRLLRLLLFGLLLSGCASSSRFAGSHSDKPAANATEVREETVAPNIVRSESPIDEHAFLAHLMPYMGIPYVYDGSDSTGFDCSGFTARMYSDILGESIPHSTADQYVMGAAVNRDALQFGDLVFFSIESSSPSHVGIYVGDGLFAHASVSLGVTISMLDSNYYRRYYCGARRIIH